MPQIVITQRGPSLSVKPAEKTHRMPNIIVFSAEAPEVIARVQPNSFIKGSKKNSERVEGSPYHYHDGSNGDDDIAVIPSRFAVIYQVLHCLPWLFAPRYSESVVGAQA